MPKNEDRDVRDSKAEAVDARTRLIDHVEVTCEALLGRGTMTIGALDRLAPGETLKLDTSPADPAEVRVNGKLIARGEIVTVDGCFAIRLTEIG
jgi:flagellar motor switch protein FliN